MENFRYLHNGHWYHSTFPVEWAENHLDGTGPGSCSICDKYGFRNGAFIGYCASCVAFKYKYERTCGFVDISPPIKNDIMIPVFNETNHTTNATVEVISEGDPIVDYNNNIYNEEDYLNADPYPDNDIDADWLVSILNPHFEDGYNDM